MMKIMILQVYKSFFFVIALIGLTELLFLLNMNE